MSKREQIIVAMGIIEHRGKVLVGLRNSLHDPAVHGLWQTPAGSVEFGEAPEQAVVREIKEETGLRVKVVAMAPKIMNVLWKKQKRHVLLPTYHCKIIGGKLLKKPPEDFEFQWITKKDYSKLKFTPGTKQALTWWFYGR